MLEELTAPHSEETDLSPGRARLRALLMLGGIALILGVAGLITALLGRSSPGHDATKRVEAYLSDLHNERYSAAYDRLCPEYGAQETHFAFVTRQLREHASGLGVATFSVTAGRTADSSAYNVAAGTVTLADGEVRRVSFFLHPSDSPPCISTVDGLD